MYKKPYGTSLYIICNSNKSSVSTWKYRLYTKYFKIRNSWLVNKILVFIDDLHVIFRQRLVWCQKSNIFFSPRLYLILFSSLWHCWVLNVDELLCWRSVFQLFFSFDMIGRRLIDRYELFKWIWRFTRF